MRLPYDTGTGYALVGPAGAIVFVYFHAETTVPIHAHGAQWGTLLQGSLEMTIDGKSSVLQPGECYGIGDHVPHGAHVGAGTALIDFFVEAHRFDLESA